MSRARCTKALLAAMVAAAGLASVAQGHEIHASADLPHAGWTGPLLVPELARDTAASAAAATASAGEELPGRFELVGHSPLLNRGMNAALAVDDGYAYIGSRTDGTHANAGVLVVDVRNPKTPTVVNEIGLPNEARPGESSRELRTIPDQDALLVLNHACSELIHRCAAPSLSGRSALTSNIAFYDIAGANAGTPKHVSTYLPSRSAPQQPHEFFLWNDPQRPGRVLLFMSTPSSDTGTQPQLVVTDVSGWRRGEFREIGTWRTRINNASRDNRLHSLTVSPDGRTAYLAYLGGGFLVLDTSDFAAAAEQPEARLITPVADRVFWTNPGAHSAIKVPGRDYALVTDEVYGKLGGVLADHGCPWGWVRMIDIADPAKPSVAAEYRRPENDPATCAGTAADREHLSSFSAHNPTLTRHLAFVTWHSAGLQAIDLTRPGAPRGAASFVPTPLPVVQTEDPALSSGRDKVVMWSFPIIDDGLIYVVDLRNGLYVLRYRGPHQGEVAATGFLDGNSNSGDAPALER